MNAVPTSSSRCIFKENEKGCNGPSNLERRLPKNIIIISAALKLHTQLTRRDFKANRTPQFSYEMLPTINNKTLTSALHS